MALSHMNTTVTSRLEITPNSWIDKISSPSEIIDAINFQELWDMHPSDYGKGMMFGKIINFPRYYQSYDKTYKFSGINNEEIPLPDALKPLKEWVDNLGYGPFQETLINWYENGHHYIGKHSDDEKDLKPRSPIISISLGATRTFRVREKNGKNGKDCERMGVALGHGDVIAMCGCFQEELKHEIVKVSGKKGLLIGPRINITFRQFK